VVLWAGVMCQGGRVWGRWSRAQRGSGTGFGLNPCASDETLVKGRPNPPGFYRHQRNFWILGCTPYHGEFGVGCWV
jgi:hypothetical protein